MHPAHRPNQNGQMQVVTTTRMWGEINYINSLMYRCSFGYILSSRPPAAIPGGGGDLVNSQSAY